MALSEPSAVAAAGNQERLTEVGLNTPRAAYHHGDLHAQLISAVRDLVESHGPDGFSVVEAARRAGVSSAAPYKHFKDRQEILRGVVAEAMDRLSRSMQTAADQHPQGSLEAVSAVGRGIGSPGKPFQPVDNRDQDVRKAALAELGHHPQPELPPRFRRSTGHGPSG